MPHVFISYDHADAGFVADLMSRIQNAGLEIWKDSASLHAGEDWRARIDEAVKTAFALMVVMTPDAAASEYVSYEWACAMGAGVRVIPLLVRAADLHPRLAAMHYLDFTNLPQAPWQTLIHELQRASETSTTSSVRIPADAPLSVKKAVDALDSFDEQEQERAIKALAQIEHPAARSALAAAVHHHSREVRIKAAMQLSRFKDARAVPGLIEAQRHWQLRWEFVRIIAAIGLPAVPGLVQALNDPDAELREYAAYGLGEIRDKSAVPALTKLSEDPVSNVRAAATKALGSINGIPGS